MGYGLGIAGNARQLLTDPPFPEILTPSAQAPRAAMSVLVRAKTGAQNGLAEAIRREARALDADMPVGELLTMPDIVEKFYPRVMIGGLGMFSLAAISLASIGLCGVVSFLVNCRTKEIGVRMALGAGRGSILRMVVGQAVRLASIGLALGVAGALLVARLLSRFIYGMNAVDPAVIAAVAAVLVAVAVAASWVPAWRAAHVNPVAALRCE